MELITTTEELAATCKRLARHPFVTIDTEFLRETTYYPLLCVAQLASTDEAVVIDALAPGIDLAPFFELMANENVLKVFHAARQDIEICWHRAQKIPHPIFDTQVAAMVLGHGDSISYDQLVQRITGDTLDKSNRFTDWTRRPLSPAQVTYAVSDVTHLRDVYTALVADLGRRGRTDWMGDDAWLAKLDVQFRKFNYVGDTHWMGGRVTRKYLFDGGRPAVDVGIWGRNQRGDVTCPGHATILLPSREHGAVRLPEPPGGATSCGQALEALVERFALNEHTAAD